VGVPRDRYLGSPLARWLLPSAAHIENTSAVLSTACVCWTVYRAVAWQRVDEICYTMINLTTFCGGYKFGNLIGYFPHSSVTFNSDFPNASCLFAIFDNYGSVPSNTQSFIATGLKSAALNFGMPFTFEGNVLSMRI
jgi:hypothetical protein